MEILRQLSAGAGSPLRVVDGYVMLVRAGIRVPLQDLQHRRELLHELIMISERMVLQSDGTYLCRYCRMYLNGPEQGEDHVVGTKHQRTKRRQRLQEESMRRAVLEDGRFILGERPGPEERIRFRPGQEERIWFRRPVLDRLRESGRVE